MKCDSVLVQRILAFALQPNDLDDALSATIERFRQQGVVMTVYLAGKGMVGGGHCTFDLGMTDDELIDSLRERLLIECADGVLLPALDGSYARLASLLWEAMRRSGKRNFIVGELDQPLARVTAWQAGDHGFATNVSNAGRDALRCFRRETLGNGAPGNVYWQADPLDECFPVYAERRLTLPETAYRIDVIIRTSGRDTLARAVNSVLAQTWPNIGLIVVNVGPRPLGDWLDQLALPSHVQPIVVEASGAGRSHAANRGLQASTGDAFVFLDDDDLIYPSHLSVLARALDARPGAVATYGGVRIEQVDERGVRRGVGMLNEPFDVERLYMENFIPIHACLVHCRVRKAGICFDDTLTHFEDWDFWLKCAEMGRFFHVPEVVGVYFAGDASGVSSADKSPVYARWLARRGVSPLEKISRWALSMDTPGARSIEREVVVLRGRLHEVEAELTSISGARSDAQEAVTRLTNECDALRQENQTLVRQLAQQQSAQQLAREEEEREEEARRALEVEKRGLEDEVRGLHHQLDVLYASTSWRAMAPLRAAVTSVRSGVGLVRRTGRLVGQHGGGPAGWYHLGGRFVRVARRQGWGYALRRGMKLLGVTAPPVQVGVIPVAVSHRGRSPRAAVGVHDVPIDIVVCIHNALEDVKRCLASIREHTEQPYRLILVDDGSAGPTRDYLAAQFADDKDVVLLRHELAGGYTKAANAGLRAGDSPFVVLLNSDTIVGPAWLDRLHACMISDERLALVGPLSNCASWQSVPEIEAPSGGDWAENPLPDGWSPADMARRIAADSMRIYPRLGFINGFCQLIRRAAIVQVGLLDEQAFPQGYGEENDMCLRLRNAGWQLAVADDVWVYHAQSKSYSNERRKRLCDAAALALAAKHGQWAIDEGVRQCRDDVALFGLRQRVAQLPERQRYIENGTREFAGRRVLFLLPSLDAGGGANVIMTDAASMRRMGVDACILNLKSNETHFTKNYGDYPVPVHYVCHPDEIAAIACQFDAVVASIYYTVDWLKPLLTLDKPPALGYYVQDFEPYFFRDGSPDYQTALSSYGEIPGLIRFCKTNWNSVTVKEKTGENTIVVGPSFDIDLFRPTQRQQRDRLRICAMIRPNSPYRSPGLTMQVLGDVWQKRPDRVDIVTFGVDIDDPDFLALHREFPFAHLGKLNSRQIAEVLDEADVFVDFSTYQAMGLTALEAMASYTATILPGVGGTRDIAEPDVSALFVSAAQPDSCQEALLRLIDDDALRNRLAATALKSVQQHFPEKSAFRILQALFPK